MVSEFCAAGEADDPVTPPGWKEAWDWAAADSYLQRIDQRDVLRRLSEERVKLDQSIAKSFERLVREVAPAAAADGAADGAANGAANGGEEQP